MEYALVGGYAVTAHGFNRFSEDVDLLVNPAAENSRRHCRAYLAGMRGYIETVDLDGVTLQLLNLQGLLLTKQGAGPKDQMDAALLIQAIAELGNKTKE